MPESFSSRPPSGWKFMARWERKQFHSENDSRARRGLPPLPKPPVKHYNGGY